MFEKTLGTSVIYISMPPLSLVYQKLYQSLRYNKFTNLTFAANGKNSTLSRTGTLPRDKLVLDDDALMSVLSGSAPDEDDVKQ